VSVDLLSNQLSTDGSATMMCTHNWNEHDARF